MDQGGAKRANKSRSFMPMRALPMEVSATRCGLAAEAISRAVTTIAIATNLNMSLNA